MSVSHWKIQCIYWVVLYDHFDFTTFRIPSRRPCGDKTSVLPLVRFFFHIFEVSIFSWDMKGQKTKKYKKMQQAKYHTHIQHPNVPTSGCFCSSQLLVDLFFGGGPEPTWNVHPPCQVPRLQRWFAPGVGSKGKTMGNFFLSPQKQFTLNMTSWHLFLMSWHLFFDVCFFEIRNIYIYMTLVNLQWSVFCFGKINPLLADSKCWSLPTRLQQPTFKTRTPFGCWTRDFDV